MSTEPMDQGSRHGSPAVGPQPGPIVGAQCLSRGRERVSEISGRQASLPGAIPCMGAVQPGETNLPVSSEHSPVLANAHIPDSPA